MKVWVYLDTGATLHFECKEMSTEVDRMTGKLRSIEWDELSGAAPFYVGIEHIVAIAREVES